jgi:hypothetical protein
MRADGKASVIPLVTPPSITSTTSPCQLDTPPDLTSENGTLQHGTDGRGSTPNP